MQILPTWLHLFLLASEFSIYEFLRYPKCIRNLVSGGARESSLAPGLFRESENIFTKRTLQMLLKL